MAALWSCWGLGRFDDVSRIRLSPDEDLATPVVKNRRVQITFLVDEAKFELCGP